MSIIKVGLIHQLEHSKTAKTEELKKLGLGYLTGLHACAIYGSVFRKNTNDTTMDKCKVIENEVFETLSVTEEPQCYDKDDED